MKSIKARFFGRRTILQDLVQGVLAPYQPLDFSLVGPRTVGKSQILVHLASEDGPLRGPDTYNWRPERFRDGHNVIVGHYDCDWPAAQEHLTQFINQRLQNQLREDKNLLLDWDRVDRASSPGQQIGQIVRQLDYKQIRLVLLLDNFDHVLRSKHITPDMVNELRPLTNELGLIVATEQPLHDLNRTLAASPLFNVMHQHFVGLLEPDAVREWLDSYNVFLPLKSDLKEALLEMTGGHPFLLARIYDIFMELQPLILDEANINQEHLPLIRLRLNEHGRRLFEMNWRKLNEERGQFALPLTKQLVQKPIPIGQVPTEQSTALNWLINQAVVTYNQNNYTLFSALYRKFLIEQFNLNQLNTASITLADADQEDIFYNLPPKEANLLRYFQTHSNQVVSVEQLLTDVWNQPNASSRRVQEAIRRLRNSLNKVSPPIGIIRNERGVGYRYIPANETSRKS